VSQDTERQTRWSKEKETVKKEENYLLLSDTGSPMKKTQPEISLTRGGNRGRGGSGPAREDAQKPSRGE